MVRRTSVSLGTRAKQQIEICCETLCERAVVEEYINFLEIEILDLKKYVAELEEAVQ